MMVNRERLGSSFDEFLQEEGILEEVSACAIKRALVRQLCEAMETSGTTEVELARLLKINEAEVSNLLGDQDLETPFQQLVSAGLALGLRPCFAYEVKGGGHDEH